MNNKIFFLAAAAAVLLSCGALRGQSGKGGDPTAAAVADRIVEEAGKYIGHPYRYGASGPKAFDCSGFSGYIYRQFGYSLSRSSKGQAGDGRAVTGPLTNLQKGDIVVFGARRNKGEVGHVGILIDVNSSGTNFRFIHAARGGVMISELREEYYRERYLGARRILPDFGSRWTSDYGGPVAAAQPAGETLPPVASQPSVAEARPELFDGSVVAAVDTLTLADSDARILLFGDGTWVYVGRDGTLIAPSSGDRLVLEGNGRWSRISGSQKTRTTRSRETVATPAPAPATTPETTGNVPQADEMYHTIQKGDTLAVLAKRYNTTVDRICELNGITRKTVLHIGRRLRVR